MDESKKLKIWVTIIILLTFLQYGLFRYIHGIAILNEADDLLIICLFIYLLFRKNPIISRRKSSYDMLFIILVSIGIISAFINQTPIVNFLLGMKNYFLYFLFFYCIYWIKFSQEETESILKSALTLFFIELVVAAFQLYSAIQSNSLTLDSVFGTFNGANLFGYAIFALLYYALYQLYFNSRKEFTIITVILVALLVLSSARLAMLLFPVIFIMLNIRKAIKTLNLKKILVVFLIVLVLPFIVNNTFTLIDRNISNYYSWSFIQNHFLETENRVESGSARNLWYPLTEKMLTDYSPSPLIGFGPGMYASFAAMRMMPPTNKLIYDYFHQTSFGLDTEVDSQIIPIWGELGYIGIIFYYILLIFMLIRMVNANKKAKNPFLQAISSTAIAYCIFFIIGSYIYHILESQTTAILLILFIALTESQQKNLKYDKKMIKNENPPD
jgi:hypothetical protein